MKSKLLSNIFGFASFICSLSFWILLGVSYIHEIPKIDPSFSCWAVIWAIGFILALIAAFVGSKRWFLAAILPVIALFGMLVRINVREAPHWKEFLS